MEIVKTIETTAKQKLIKKLVCELINKEKSELISEELEKIEVFSHYTSISKLFYILESDSFWLSGLRFSNDSSEENLFGDDWIKSNKYKSDNFVLCGSNNEDILSQWRGYCPNGGASITLDLFEIHKYHVLHPNFKDNDVENYMGIDALGIPVLYGEIESSYKPIKDGSKGVQSIAKEIQEILGKDDTYKSLTINDFVPYIKHKDFSEEQETRLLFSNSNGELSEYVRFRPLKNGTKVPYIVIKNGYIKDSDKTKEGTSRKNIEKIWKNQKSRRKVIIPYCSNQRNIHSLMRKYIGSKFQKVRIYCEGHLPIRKITIAPMPDQNRIKEQVKRFCDSKYWLEDVEVTVSNTPYVFSINNLALD